VFLLEVNMSPNLSSQTHPENGALYRAVLKNAFQMMELSSSFRPVEWESRICALPQPIDCSQSEARFCKPCLSFDQSLLLAQISSEYLNKNWFQLVSPAPPSRRRSLVKGETPLATFQREFFHRKCKTDSHWCYH